jgi:glycerophosphoryl diester phosphodiesterase
MKIRILIMSAAAVCSIACGGGQKPVKDVKIIAHRGYWDKEGASKNSIASLKNAIEFGAFGSEFDVLVTSDGVPVVHHDDKTVNGILIESVTFAELMEQAPVLLNGERIPALDDYLKAWNSAATKLILEIKSASTPELETFFVESILDVVSRHGVENSRIEYIAFSWHVVNELRRLAPEVTVSYLNGDKTPAEVKAAGVAGIDYRDRVFKEKPQWIKEAVEQGLIVNVWTVDDEATMRQMIELGADYITTDNPVLLKEVIGSYGRTGNS